MTTVNTIHSINSQSVTQSEETASAFSGKDAKEIVQKIPSIQFANSGTDPTLRKSIDDAPKSQSKKIDRKDYLPASVERKKFNEVLEKVAEIVSNSSSPFKQSECAAPLPKLLKGTAWNQKEALLTGHQFPELGKIIGNDFTPYSTPDSMLIMGPHLGTGVTREVRVCAEIVSGKINICAANLLRSEHMSKVSVHPKVIDKLPEAISEQLRTFQMQERLRDIEPNLPKVINTLHWMRSDASLHHVDTVCVLTELLHGNLRDCINALASIPGLDFIIKFRALHQVSKQLERFHQNGIVHRDIHDNNVLVLLESASSTEKLVDVKLRATLCDFETVGPVISQNIKAQGPLETSLAEIGFLKKAPRSDGPFHPPELRKVGSDWIRDYTPAADVFAFGMMVLVQFGGEQLLTGETPPEYAQHLQSDHPGLPTASRYTYWNPECLTSDYIHKTLDFLPGFAKLISATLADAPEKRPSALEIASFFDSSEEAFNHYFLQKYG